MNIAFKSKISVLGHAGPFGLRWERLCGGRKFPLELNNSTQITKAAQVKKALKRRAHLKKKQRNRKNKATVHAPSHKHLRKV